ncbi:MAG: hypothetical protein OXC84_08940 [Gammaproteobacteria bacterium]|nr:hypothetical protein [Gammaproteobacteria bacterium]
MLDIRLEKILAWTGAAVPDHLDTVVIQQASQMGDILPHFIGVFLLGLWIHRGLDPGELGH